MYPVSEEYLNKISGQSVTTDWNGQIRTKVGMTYPIRPETIVEGSGSIIRQICSKSDLEIGTTCSAELSIQLYLDGVERYELYDGTITMDFKLLLDGGNYETVPLGTFYITDPPERSMNIISIHAYDAMQKFNKNFGLYLQGTAYYLLQYACNACGVELGATQDEIAGYPNGLVETYTYQELEIYTYRDLVGYVASFLCCFAYIGPDNRLYLKPYESDPVREISENWRFEYKPKDYESFFTSITAYFAVSQKTEAVSIAAETAGLTYNLGTNPLIQFNDDDFRKTVLRNIITKLASVSYTPFEGKFPCDPALMVGDVLNFTGNHAVNGKLAAITKQVITINGGMSLECAGADPDYIMTATEKLIAGAYASNTQDGMRYYDYANTEEITIRDGREAVVISINYITKKETHVDFHGEIKCQVETTETYDESNDEYTENDGVIYVSYIEGGSEITEYYPVDSFFDGTHLLHLVYTWWASSNIRSSFEVRLKCEGCTVTIGQAESRGYMAGEGLIGDTTPDDAIRVYDTFAPIDFSRIRKNFTDAVEIKQIRPAGSSLYDNLAKINFFTQIFGGIKDDIMMNSLHRFSVPYNADEMDTENIIWANNVWYNENQQIDGTVTTPDCRVSRIYRVSSNRTPNSGDVTYIVSFDSGETWYSYASGWVPYESGYGMVESDMAAVPSDEWNVMIVNGTVMVKAILQGDATLTDIQIFTAVIKDGTMIEHSDAVTYDETVVADNRDNIGLVYEKSYEGQAGSIDDGYLEELPIDTNSISAITGIQITESHDTYKDFKLFDQPNLRTDFQYQSGGPFVKQSDGSWYGSQSANVAQMWSVPIPKKYRLLAIDMESTGRRGSYNLSTIYLRDAYGVTGIYGGNFAGNNLKTINLVNYSSTSEAINEQYGVKIQSSTPYELSRQIVLIDISGIETNIFIGWHRCDNATRIYSITAIL